MNREQPSRIQCTPSELDDLHGRHHWLSLEFRIYSFEAEHGSTRGMAGNETDVLGCEFGVRSQFGWPQRRSTPGSWSRGEYLSLTK